MGDLLPYRSEGVSASLSAMERIVVGVDGSRWSKDALRWAAQEAQRSGASLQVVMIWDDPARDMWIPSSPPGVDRLAQTRRAVSRVVRSVLGEHPTVVVETSVVEGSPGHALVEAAKGAELLVVGSRGRGGFAGALFGSVSLHCVSHAPCPVVVVRGKTKPT